LTSHTGWIRTQRELVSGLETLREHIGRPIGVLSGFRDFNLGASQSQHKFGNATDPTETLPHDLHRSVLTTAQGISQGSRL
jgi:hypothetical protein